MKTIRNILLISLTTLVISQARGEDTQAAKKDLAQLQGEWAMTTGVRDGQSLPDEMLKNSKRSCKGDETTVVVGGQLLMKTKFTLDPSTKPKSIDYQITGGSNAGKTQLGIYELDGDTVKFCFATPGKDRPTDFTTKAGDGRTSSVWKREKK
jgi:uncharacterized protein (TIGR03067 family)